MRNSKISKARQNLFDKFGVTVDQAQSYHRELETQLDKLKTVYHLSFTGNSESDGNLILEDALLNRKRNEEKIYARAIARSKYSSAFYDTFKVFLEKYWLGNLLGFDCIKFDIEIVKPSENESTYQAINRQWGDKGVELIRQLVI